MSRIKLGKNVADLTWVGPTETSECGCTWRRSAEYGDVVLMQCEDHALEGTMSDIRELAEEVVTQGLDEEDAEDRLGEMCTRHGPAAVQVLDEFFAREVARLRAGQGSPPP